MYLGPLSHLQAWGMLGNSLQTCFARPLLRRALDICTTLACCHTLGPSQFRLAVDLWRAWRVHLATDRELTVLSLVVFVLPGSQKILVQQRAPVSQVLIYLANPHLTGIEWTAAVSRGSRGMAGPLPAARAADGCGCSPAPGRPDPWVRLLP